MRPDSTQGKDVAGIVLAAGGATRFGSAKVLAPLYGKPLVDHVLEAAEGGFGRLVVVVGARSDEVRQHLGHPHVDSVVINERWSEGLSTSLQIGVEDCEGFLAVMILLADQPMINRAVIKRVLDARLPAQFDAIRATYAGEPGHPVLLERSAILRVPELTGDEGMRTILRGSRVRLIACEDVADGRDVDTAADLADLQREQNTSA